MEEEYQFFAKNQGITNIKNSYLKNQFNVTNADLEQMNYDELDKLYTQIRNNPIGPSAAQKQGVEQYRTYKSNKMED